MENIEIKALKIIKKYGPEKFVSSMYMSDYIVIKKDFHLVNGFYKNRFITEEFSSQVIMRERLYKIQELINRAEQKNNLQESASLRMKHVKNLINNINYVYAKESDTNEFDRNVEKLINKLETKLVINDKKLEDITLSETELTEQKKFISYCTTQIEKGKSFKPKYEEDLEM